MKLTKWQWCLVAAIVAYFTVFGIASAIRGSNRLGWRSVGISAHPVAFVDLNVITRAIDCTTPTTSGEVYTTPCLTSQNIQYNYPTIWLNLRYLGITAQYNSIYGVILIIAFLSCCLCIIKPCNTRDCVAAAAALLSPSVMLLLERGNSDIVIFILVAMIAIQQASNSWAIRAASYVLIFVAAVLKLYPALLFWLIYRERHLRVRVTGAIALVAFALYGLAIRDQVAAVALSTPTIIELSYGARIPLLALTKLVDDNLKSVPQPYPLGKLAEKLISPALTRHGQQSDFLRADGTKYFTIGIVAFLVVLAAATVKSRYIIADAFESASLQAKTLFLSGALIYLGTYILSVSFDYRLTFTLLCLPLLMVLRNHQPLGSDSARYATTAISLLITTLWLSRAPFLLIGGIDEIANLLLAMVLGVILVQTSLRELRAQYLTRLT